MVPSASRLNRSAYLGVVAAVLSFVCACNRKPDPRELVEAAIEAHGGREQLARLNNVKLIGRGRFKGQLEIVGTISFVAPDTFATEARLGGHVAMQFGMDGDRCWQRTRHFVRDCSADDEREYRRFGEVLRFRLLHGLEGRSLVPVGYRNVGGIEAPSVSVGDFVLAFHPTTHLLIEVSSGDRVETYSDFRQFGGVLIGTSRTVLINGEIDVHDTWDDIHFDQADAKALHPPLPADGQTMDDIDPERWVATTEIADLEDDLVVALGSLDDFAREHGQVVSASEGIVLTQPPRENSADARRWELSVGLEPTTAGLPSTPGTTFRFERWPEVRFVGVFHQGAPLVIAEKEEILRRLMHETGVTPAPGSRLQFVCTREGLAQPLESRVCLMRLVVEPVAVALPSPAAAQE
jgi:hypothetical protein